jgi:thiol-disulfide isomerase/thioredoxin
VSFFNRYFFAGVGAGCLLSIVGGVLVVAGLGFLAMRGMPDAMDMSAMLRPPDFPAKDQLTVYGEADPDWSVQSLDGDPVSMAELEGKVVFLNLWATWCMPCVAEMPSIQELHRSLEGEEVAFLLVSDEDAETVRGLLEEEGLDLPVYLRTGDLPAEFASRGIPATFIIDPEGTIVYRHVGSAKWGDESCAEFIRGLL